MYIELKNVKLLCQERKINFERQLLVTLVSSTGEDVVAVAG